MAEVHAVTGAFGFTGRYIARRLLAAGVQVRTLTNTRPQHDPFQGRVEVYPLAFDDPPSLVEALRGVRVLYNTYWVRFDYPPHFTFAQAVANSVTLFRAAREAGVERVVHISITNASEEAPLPYFRGKGQVERALRQSGLSYAILRPPLIFGEGAILVNNIAWVLRRFPVFGLFGDGRYRLRTVYVDDLAALAVAAGQAGEDQTVDAVGPDTFTFRELVACLASVIGVRRLIVPMPPRVAYLATRVLGQMVHDVLVTWDEVRGLMGEYLYVDATPVGQTTLAAWAEAHREELGRSYASELARRHLKHRQAVAP